MRAKPLSQDLGATAACVMRGVVSSRKILLLPLAGESSPSLHPEGNEVLELRPHRFWFLMTNDRLGRLPDFVVLRKNEDKEEDNIKKR